MSLRLMRVTSQTDGRAHRVTDDAFADGLTRGEGTFHALCGHRVLAVPMICEDGPECPGCARDETARATATGGRRRHPLRWRFRARAAMDG
jgi:hypothetical protein